jgi:hypothetical protein
MSRFSKNEPELRACRRISRHLNRIESRLTFSSDTVLFLRVAAIPDFSDFLNLFHLHDFSDIQPCEIINPPPGIAPRRH